MRVLSVDPGPSTGYAVWENAVPEPTPSTEFFGAYVHEPYDAIDIVRAELIRGGVDAVVCEAFRIGGQRGRDSNVTIEIIGVLRWMCHKADVHFEEQAPGLGLKFAGTRWAKLRRLGWYSPGPDHANSAAGHLIYYLAQTVEGFAQRLLVP